MSKKENKKPLIKTKQRADGNTDYIITKAPQSTVWGKVIIIVLAAMLALGSIVGLILVLLEL